ncbi:ROK family transcriptional regulator [Salipiger mangrovisoli]|uniref:ROK family transcriptional regulator n=1 Tax=Salipiger mangrovisoli TaxID=2865933 RepID=A0ABR9XAT8_9RHOB|nr:ROK family transcriptional regulator [Salipiger mangrovisoli]MBE9640589.1 ROK family transcriptional regulator [Salipiger mangrovisoli]
MKRIQLLDYYSGLFGAAGPEGRKGRILARIAGSDGQTRKRLAEDMCIRPATVSKLVLELIQVGLVREGRPEVAGQKGRPEIALAANPQGLVSIVCNTVSRGLHCALVDMAGKVLVADQCELDADTIGHEAFVAALLDLVRAAEGHVPLDSRLAGVVLSLPGIVDEDNRVWRYAAHWPNLTELDFAGMEARLGMPFLLAKNLKCELRARMSESDARAHDATLLLHWGYGIGAAFARRGALDLQYGSFGEVGHFCVDPRSTARCKCGMTGCIEAEAGLWALLDRLGDPSLPSDEWGFADVLAARPDVADWSMSIEYIALCLRNLVLTLKPDHCVITGPFSQTPQIMRALRARFSEVMPANALVVGGTPDLDVGAPGIGYEVVGASALAFGEALKNICGVQGLGVSKTMSRTDMQADD